MINATETLVGSLRNTDALSGSVQSDSSLDGAVQSTGTISGSVQGNSTISGDVQSRGFLSGSVQSTEKISGQLSVRQSEVDPTVPEYVKQITEEDIEKWNIEVDTSMYPSSAITNSEIENIIKGFAD